MGADMKIVDRYLARAVVSGSLVTLAVLLPLIAFFMLADELDAVKDEGYRLTDALLYVAMALPRFAYQLFPIATLIGALVGLGSLASRSELVAMRAAGVSIARIVGASLLGGVVLAVGAMVVGEGLAPIAEQEGARLRSQAVSGQVTLATPYGFWARDGGTFVNIREILPGGDLRDISIYEVDNGRSLTLATHAARARYVEGAWVLEDVARSRVSPEGVEVERLAREDWASRISPSLLEVVVVQPQMLPIWGLHQYIRYMHANDQDAGPYEVAFWGKVVQPFLILAMIFVSIPLLLGSSRTSGTGTRVFIGILAGIVFYLVSRTFSYLALLYGLSPVVAALTPPLLYLAAALWVLRRVG
jgi:lipopolysaccharide export system permease protein